MDWRHTNWQTRLALDWLVDAPETVSDWKAHAATRDVSTVANDLAMVTAQSIDWRVLASAVTDNDHADVARKDYRDLH